MICSIDCRPAPAGRLVGSDGTVVPFSPYRQIDIDLESGWGRGHGYWPDQGMDLFFLPPPVTILFRSRTSQ